MRDMQEDFYADENNWFAVINSYVIILIRLIKLKSPYYAYMFWCSMSRDLFALSNPTCGRMRQREMVNDTESFFADI